MTKCAVRSARKWSAGSKSDAAFAVPHSAAASSRTPAAVSARATPLRLARLRVCVLGVTVGTREDDAEDERRNPKEAGANEKEAVPFEQRAPGSQALHHDARETFRELADV